MFFKKPLKVEKNDGDRVPPGQTVTDKFPVLTDGPAPTVEKSEWVFEIKYENEVLRSFNWEEFNNLKQETIETDIHCVTRWSKLDTVWNGVYIDELVDGLFDKEKHNFVMAYCFGGYTTNLPLEDIMDKKGTVVTIFDGKDLEKAIMISKKNGAKGISIFTADGLNKEQQAVFVKLKNQI